MLLVQQVQQQELVQLYRNRHLSMKELHELNSCHMQEQLRSRLELELVRSTSVLRSRLELVRSTLEPGSSHSSCTASASAS